MFLIEFFGEQNLPPVFGMLMLSYGVSGIIGAPIAGLVYFLLAHLDLFLIQICFYGPFQTISRISNRPLSRCGLAH